MASVYEVFFSPQNIGVTMKLLRYTLLMILLPIGSFYGSYYFLFEGDQDYLAWSGIIAVIVVNLVIAAYVWMAWHEDEDQQTPTDRRKID